MLIYQPLDDTIYQQILPLIEQTGAYDEFDLKTAQEQQTVYKHLSKTYLVKVIKI